MENFIKTIEVDRFRGLKNLYLNDLKKINVIVGDNNSGKTSLLEAIMLTKNTSIANIFNSCMRKKNTGLGSFFTEFLYIFPQKEKMNVKISTVFATNNRYNYILNGNIDDTIFDISKYSEDDMNLIKIVFGSNDLPRIIKQFNGKLTIQENGTLQSEQTLDINAYSGLRNFVMREKKSLANIVYLSPFDYANNSFFKNVIDNDDYKEICVNVLKIFDNSIEDLLLKYDELHSPIECVKSNKIGVVPLSTYGDGIKKVLNIAGGIAAAHNGILMIDEFEVAIHVKNYDDIFNFIVKACSQYNVQLFITTHSIESVDALLKIDQIVEKDEVNFITLRKNEEENKTLSRIMSAKDVKNNRENFDFEVRL